jgi:hypothetical protein
MKYNIEGNIDFYSELFNSLDKDDTDDNICLITGLPLTSDFVTLECNHKFNYDALFTEIHRQKFKYKTYDKTHLNKNMLEKYMSSGKNYYIRCPYCRNIQFEILPYIEEKQKQKVYGINTLDTNYYVNEQIIHSPHTCIYKGNTYNLGPNKCEYGNQQVDDDSGNYKHECYSKYCSYNDKLKGFYCMRHYAKSMREYDKKERAKSKQQKLAEKEKLKQEKAEAKEKLKQEKAEAKEKLKKEKASNKVISNTNITQYVPDNEDGVITCSAVLKCGPNKGSLCGNKPHMDGLCRRHCKKKEPKEEDTENN